MKTLLVTGASGFLGWYAGHYFSRDWRVVGTYATRAIASWPGVFYELDLTSEQSIQACWDLAKPDAVLHAAAISKVSACQQNPDYSFAVNVSGSERLAQRAAAAGIPFIFTSTDLVFDGEHPPYQEAALPNPVNLYGQQKAEAERRILEVYPGATICRLPLMFGAKTPTAGCFLQDFLEAIAAGKTLHLFTDEIRTPAAVTDVIQGIGLALDQRITGILHLGGPQSISRYDFGLLLAETFKLPDRFMVPCLQSSVPNLPPRPKNVSLNSERAFSWGYSPQTVHTALQAIAQQAAAASQI